MLVNSTDDVCVLGASYSSNHMVPIFLISNVSGKNLELLRAFLNLLTPHSHAAEAECGLPAFLQIDEVFNVHDVGPVVAGTLQQGVVRVGDELLLGPDEDGRFFSVVVTSIHRNRVAYHLVKAGQHASFAVSGVRRPHLRPGQIMTADVARRVSCHEFEADVTIASTSPPLSHGAQVTVFVGAVRQPANVSLHGVAAVSPGETARVRFVFVNRPEHIQAGARMLLHDQRLHGFGTVIRVTHDVIGAPPLPTPLVEGPGDSSLLDAMIERRLREARREESGDKGEKGEKEEQAQAAEGGVEAVKEESAMSEPQQ